MKRTILLLAVVVVACQVTYGQEEIGPNYEHLKCYEAWIGDWQYEGPLKEGEGTPGEKGDQVVIDVSVRWILNKNVVEMNWHVKSEEEVLESGKTLYGWDAVNQHVFVGSMDSQGDTGVGTEVYNDSKKLWTATMKGMKADGTTTSATVIHEMPDKNTVLWQARNRSGGELEGDSPIYTYKRVK